MGFLDELAKLLKNRIEKLDTGAHIESVKTTSVPPKKKFKRSITPKRVQPQRQTKYHCSVCEELGHNRTSHENRKRKGWRKKYEKLV